jgi:hypothetical protein
VRFLTLAGAVLDVVMLCIDSGLGVPVSWIRPEGPYVILLSGLIFWLAGRLPPEDFKPELRPPN